MASLNRIAKPVLIKKLEEISPHDSFYWWTKCQDKSSPEFGRVEEFRADWYNAVKRLKLLNSRGYGIFVLINSRYEKASSRQKKDIAGCRAVWIEQDADLIVPLGLTPTCVHETSPGKHHIYYILNEICTDKQAWSNLMQLMVEKYASDPGAKDLSRVMRVPGFYNWKYGTEEKWLVTENSLTLGDKVPAGSSKLYQFEYLVRKLNNPETEVGNQWDSKYEQAVKDIISGAALHPSLISIAQTLANKGFNEGSITTQLEAFMSASAARVSEPARWETRCKDIPNIVKSAIIKADTRTDYTDDVDNKEYNDIVITELDWPPGNAGIVARDIYSNIRHPSKELAIICALGLGCAFGGRRWYHKGNGLTSKFVVLAEQARGKDILTRYPSKLVGCLARPDPETHEPLARNAESILTSAGATTPKLIHGLLQEQPNRLMIMSEAGQQSKNNDYEKPVYQYTLQLISADYDQIIQPRIQNVDKGEEKLRAIYGPCAAIIHESVPHNYLEVLRSTNAIETGELARCHVYCINPSKLEDIIHEDIGEPSKEVQLLFSKLVNYSINDTQVPINVPPPPKFFNKVEYEDSSLGFEFHKLELEQIKRYNKDDSFKRAAYARYVQKMMTMCLVLAVYDADFSQDPPRAVITWEHYKWAKEHEDATVKTIIELNEMGGFSGSDIEAITVIKQAIRELVLNNAENSLPRKHQYIPRSKLTNKLQHNKSFKTYRDDLHHGKTSLALDTALRELESRGDIELLVSNGKNPKVIGRKKQLGILEHGEIIRYMRKL